MQQIGSVNTVLMFYYPEIHCLLLIETEVHFTIVCQHQLTAYRRFDGRYGLISEFGSSHRSEIITTVTYLTLRLLKHEFGKGNKFQ